MNIYRGSIVICFAFFSDGMNLCAHIYVCLNHSSHYIYTKQKIWENATWFCKVKLLKYCVDY